jgi:hypothetical protein
MLAAISASSAVTTQLWVSASRRRAAGKLAFPAVQVSSQPVGVRSSVQPAASRLGQIRRQVAGSRPRFTALTNASWSRSVWSAYARANRHIARSTRSDVPR